MRYTDLADADCAIAQALGVVGDWWTLLVVRDVAGGVHRFDALAAELGVSRKVLAQRLAALVDHGVLDRRRYQDHPPRYEYHLSAAGRGLLPVLIALQDWGSRYVSGDGTLSATGVEGSAEVRAARALVGTRIPSVLLGRGAGSVDPVADTPRTVLFCFPGGYQPGVQGYPPGWGDIPGAPGCTLESRTYQARAADFAERGASVRGVSTQRPDQLDAFAEYEGIRFPLLSDADLALTAALRLPTFRAAGVDRLKRLTLVVDADRVIRAVDYPITDPAASVDDALRLATATPSG